MVPVPKHRSHLGSNPGRTIHLARSRAMKYSTDGTIIMFIFICVDVNNICLGESGYYCMAKHGLLTK